MNYYDKEVARLQRELREAEEKRDRYAAAESVIAIGVKIMDLDNHREMIVDRLKNGSNDFEASPVAGGTGRGYYYLVENWKVI